MSIENDLKRIADALEVLAGKAQLISEQDVAAEEPVVEEPTVDTPVDDLDTGVPVPQLDETPVAKSKHFQSEQDLIDYVVAHYKKLGSERGAGIQAVIERMGHTRISELAEHEWDAFKEEIDKL